MTRSPFPPSFLPSFLPTICLDTWALQSQQSLHSRDSADREQNRDTNHWMIASGISPNFSAVAVLVDLDVVAVVCGIGGDTVVAFTGVEPDVTQATLLARRPGAQEDADHISAIAFGGKRLFVARTFWGVVETIDVDVSSESPMTLVGSGRSCLEHAFRKPKHITTSISTPTVVVVGDADAIWVFGADGQVVRRIPCAGASMIPCDRFVVNAKTGAVTSLLTGSHFGTAPEGRVSAALPWRDGCLIVQDRAMTWVSATGAKTIPLEFVGMRRSGSAAVSSKRGLLCSIPKAVYVRMTDVMLRDAFLEHMAV